MGAEHKEKTDGSLEIPTVWYPVTASKGPFGLIKYEYEVGYSIVEGGENKNLVGVYVRRDGKIERTCVIQIFSTEAAEKIRDINEKLDQIIDHPSEYL